MSLCHQFDAYGHDPQPSAPRDMPPSVPSNRRLMCGKCGDPLDGHEMFGECFPEAYLGGSPPLIVRDGRIVAV